MLQRPTSDFDNFRYIKTIEMRTCTEDTSVPGMAQSMQAQVLWY